MAKSKNHPAVGNFSGNIGGMEFADYKDKQIIRKPYERKPTTKWTEPQVATQGNFINAKQYGKEVLADPDKKAAYKLAAREKNRSEWNLAIGDALTPPTIIEIDPSRYSGQTGERIVIEAVDDMKITSLTVAIRNLAGAIVEEGPAKLDTKNKKPKWIYATTTTVPAGEIAVTIEVTVMDMPGNKVIKQADRILRRPG
jgi:hypothetical protein